ncbi:HET-domain-containing protein [Nemania abortiva]|nr:HET-domain-containing protein [Nemania abortiva]
MYSYLDQSKHQIRLLRLLPSRGFDEIHCDLFTVSLDDPNEFEALSYVWGSEKDPIQIIIGGQIKDVTENLGLALRHLRNDEKDRILWVDAVCINQDDQDERSSQVQLMQRIYSCASLVVAWLGPHPKEYEQIIEAIRRLGNDSRLHWTAIPKMEDILLRLSIFLRNVWWSRIWTVQEAILAKQVIYHCGKVHLSTHDITSMAASYRKHVHPNRCCGVLRIPGHGISVATSLTTAVENILQLRRFQQRIRNANFDEVAFLFRHRHATDPRDKIYGLLGISCGIRESSIDYHFSKDKVYELATRDIISHNKNLNILSHVFHERLGSPFSDQSVFWPKDTPSWVPNWAATDKQADGEIEFIRYRAPFLHHYNACGTLTYKSMKDDPVGKLHLTGVRCGTVKAISNSVCSQPLSTKVHTIKDWRDMSEMEKDPGKAYVGGDTVSEAFWRTLCLDIHTCDALSEGETNFTRRADAEDRDAHLVYWYIQLSSHSTATYQRKPGFAKMATEFIDHMSGAIMQRSFFISREGYMGLGPLGIEVGDHLCVLAGGRAPFIVRAVQQSDDKATSRFVCRFLGDCYIHGLMDGEAMKLVDDGVLQVEDFELI